jgi:hypothetical protein
MKMSEAKELKPGTQLVTTTGVPVVFKKLTKTQMDENYRHGTARNFAVVTMPDGTETLLPPRSLHRGRTSL